MWSQETRGHCCLPGQHWADDRCEGTPAECPPDYRIDGSTCTRMPVCSPGLERSEATQGHCCWPGQSWENFTCKGVPQRCPAWLFASKEKQSCEQGPKCLAGREWSQATEGHCCWPGQRWEDHWCKGVPSRCPPGFKVTQGKEDCEEVRHPLVDELLRHTFYFYVSTGLKIVNMPGATYYRWRTPVFFRVYGFAFDLGMDWYSSGARDSLRLSTSAGIAPLTVAVHPGVSTDGSSHVTLLEPTLLVRYTSPPLSHTDAINDPSSKLAQFPGGGFSLVGQTRIHWNRWYGIQGINLEVEWGFPPGVPTNPRWGFWAVAIDLILYGSDPHAANLTRVKRVLD